MFRRRKLLLALGAALVLAAFFFRQPAPRYDGLAIDEWFQRYSAARLSNSAKPSAPAEAAFKAMGADAVPYLVKFINQPQGYTRLSLLRAKHHRRIPRFLTPLLPRYPSERFVQGMDAAELLATQVKPPGRLLVPAITTALQSSNATQRCIAFAALRGVTADYEITQPHLARGLMDPDPRVQKFAAMAIRWHDHHGRWAITNLLQAATTTNFEVFEFTLEALNALGTNSIPVLPGLTNLLATQTQENRRQILAESIERISKSRPVP